MQDGLHSVCFYIQSTYTARYLLKRFRLSALLGGIMVFPHQRFEPATSELHSKFPDHYSMLPLPTGIASTLSDFSFWSWTYDRIPAGKSNLSVTEWFILLKRVTVISLWTAFGVFFGELYMPRISKEGQIYLFLRKKNHILKPLCSDLSNSGVNVASSWCQAQTLNRKLTTVMHNLHLPC